VTVNGAKLYWRSWGSKSTRTPLVVVHGGYGLADDFEPLAKLWSADRLVIGIDLDGHGHSPHSGRPFRYLTFGDDIAGVIRQLGVGQVDLLGRSLGGGSALRCAIQHPAVIRRLILVSQPHRRSGWYPEVTAQFDGMTSAVLHPMLSRSPLFTRYTAVAPDVNGFPALIDSMGDLLRQPYDWSEEVKGIKLPVLLVVGDVDSIPPVAVAEFHALLGGGKRDASWDNSGITTQSRLAILPGATHYDIMENPALPTLVTWFSNQE